MAKAYGALYGIRLEVEDIPRSNPDRIKTWDSQKEDIKNGISLCFVD